MGLGRWVPELFFSKSVSLFPAEGGEAAQGLWIGWSRAHVAGAGGAWQGAGLGGLDLSVLLSQQGALVLCHTGVLGKHRGRVG